MGLMKESMAPFIQELVRVVTYIETVKSIEGLEIKMAELIAFVNSS
jgi:hypothetical protein